MLGRCLVSPRMKATPSSSTWPTTSLIWTTRYAGMYSTTWRKSPHGADRRLGVRRGAAAEAPHGRAGQPVGDDEGVDPPDARPQVRPARRALEKFAEAYTTTNRMVRIYKVLGVSKRATGAEHGRGTRWRSRRWPRRTTSAQIHGFELAASGWGRFEKLWEREQLRNTAAAFRRTHQQPPSAAPRLGLGANCQTRDARACHGARSHYRRRVGRGWLIGGAGERRSSPTVSATSLRPSAPASGGNQRLR